jgi:hypothetical protein
MEEPIRDGLLDILTKKRKLSPDNKSLYEMVKNKLKGSLPDHKLPQSTKGKHTEDGSEEEEEEEENDNSQRISKRMRECFIINTSDPHDLMCIKTAPKCNLWWIVLKEIKTGNMNIKYELAFQKNPLDVLSYSTAQTTQKQTNRNTKTKRKPVMTYGCKQAHKVVMVAGPWEHKHKLEHIDTKSEGIKFMYEIARKHKKKIYR